MQLATAALNSKKHTITYMYIHVSTCRHMYTCTLLCIYVSVVSLIIIITLRQQNVAGYSLLSLFGVVKTQPIAMVTLNKLPPHMYTST